MKKEQNKLPEEKEEKKQSGEVSRRDFLVGAGTVVVGGAIGAGLLSGCGDGEEKTVTTTIEKTKTVTTTIGEGVPVTVTETTQVGDGETITKTTTITGTGETIEPAFEEEKEFFVGHALGGFSGGGEPCAVYVKNNKIVRIAPYHFTQNYTEEEIAPAIWSFEAANKKTGEMKTFKPILKGLPGYFACSYKKRIYSPNRVRYPLKRIDWEPGGVNVNAQNRGISKFKRINWDEATEIVASELKRVIDTYGSNSILLQGDGHSESKCIQGPHGCHTRLLKQFGPATRQIRNPDSWEGWYWGSKHFWGGDIFGTQAYARSSNMYDISVHSDMVVAQGCDWESTPNGFSGRFMSRLSQFWRELDIFKVFICPDCNYQAAVHADKWIPILPDTDAAMQLAVIYTWLDEDTYDKDFIDTHSYGFDTFKAYVMGNEDGIPKTPAWASPKCGVPEWTIKAHARKVAKSTASYIHYWGGSFIRGPYSHEPARLEAVELCMQGWGKPGVDQVSMSLTMPGSTALGMMGFQENGTGDPSATLQDQSIPKTLIHKAISGNYTVDNPMEWYGSAQFYTPASDQFVKYRYPIAAEDGGAEIHMIWCDNPCRTACWNGGFETIEAHRNDKIQCIVMQHPWLENDMIFSDIILPSNTMFEEDDILAASWAANQVNWAALVKHCIEPVGESKGDWDIVVAIAEKMGVADAVTDGQTNEEKIKAVYDSTPLSDLIAWDKLNEKQYMLMPCPEDWQNGSDAPLAFYTDPVNNPLGTPTGLLEFTSYNISEYLPDDKERPIHPTWVEGGSATDGWAHDERIDGERFEAYPLLLVSNHPRWRMHVQCDDSTWIREIRTCKIKGHDGYMYEPVWMHPDDAADRGLEDGDIVKVYNERGTVLGAVYITQRIIKGAVLQDHGAHVDLICDGVDRGGSNNLISPPNTTSKNCAGMATSGFLVQVEKVTGEQMQEWRETYPEAFARAYDPACGLKFEAWVTDEEEK